MPARGAAATTGRRTTVKPNLSAASMSKAQLMAFLAKAQASPELQLRIDAAADASAVTALAREEGFLFSPASLARHLRG